MRGGRGGQLNSSDVTIPQQSSRYKEIKRLREGYMPVSSLCMREGVSISGHTFNQNENQN